jgi:hypothetical protein
MMVMVADADTLGFLTLVAVTETVEFCVSLGAVKLPLASIDPAPPARPAAPGVSILVTVQVTPEVSLVTVAVNCVVCPLPTKAVLGEIETSVGIFGLEEHPKR